MKNEMGPRQKREEIKKKKTAKCNKSRPVVAWSLIYELKVVQSGPYCTLYDDTMQKKKNKLNVLSGACQSFVHESAAKSRP